MANTAPAYSTPVIALPESDRVSFMIKVYQHLAVAIGAFIAIEYLLFAVGVAEGLYNFLAGSGAGWLLILGAVMVIQWFAANAASDLLNTSRQYVGLFAMAFGEALIFAPFLYYVFNVRDSASTVASAAVVTGMGFAGLSATAWFTRKDLSFLRPIVMWGFMAALVMIVASVIFGWHMGTWFSVLMIGLAGAAILWQTQTILRHYPAQAYVGASVQLFASLMTMFWYVLRIFMDR